MFEAFTIKRGTFALSCDVENPKPRKRSRDWRHQAVWKAGTKFIIDDWHGGGRRGVEEPLACLRPQSDRFGGITSFDDAFWPIMRYLVPVEETPSDMLARIDLTNWMPELLDALCARGCFTLADAEATVKALVAADVAEYEAREQAKKEADK